MFSFRNLWKTKVFFMMKMIKSIICLIEIGVKYFVYGKLISLAKFWVITLTVSFENLQKKLKFCEKEMCFFGYE